MRQYPNWKDLPPNVKHLLVAILTAIVTVGVTIAIVQPGSTPKNPKPGKTIRVTLGGPKVTSLGKTKVTTIPLTAEAQKILNAQKAENAVGNTTVAESQLNAPNPSPEAVVAAKSVQPPGQPVIPAHVPLASAYQPGCTTAFVRNYSSRRGAPIDLGVIHWTGSPITAGPAGGLSIVSWFDQSAAQASSNYITDQAARCWYVVPETLKAWTQAAANPWSVSVEIVNPGVLPLFRNQAAEEAVVRLMIGWHHRWHIPYRYGRVNSNCVPVVSGFLAHRDLGPCGGGHPDVGVPSAVGELIARARAEDQSAKPISATENMWCRKLTWWRNAHRPGGHARANAIRRSQLLRRHNVSCVGGHTRKG